MVEIAIATMEVRDRVNRVVWPENSYKIDIIFTAFTHTNYVTINTRFAPLWTRLDCLNIAHHRQNNRFTLDSSIGRPTSATISRSWMKKERLVDATASAARSGSTVYRPLLHSCV
jgi:hypothetical protein